jgi:hypothetical protein
MDQQIEDEIVDTRCGTARMLKEIESSPSIPIERGDLAVQHGSVRKFSESLGHSRKLSVERFAAT